MSSDLISIELADTLDVDISGTLIKGDDGFSPIINITQLPNGIRIVTTDVDKTSEGEVVVSKENVTAALGYVPADETILPTKVDKIEGKELSTNDFTNELKSKLENIEENAEVNIQSDWTETDSTSDAYILNKPDIYITTEVDNFLAEKADKSTTIAGYGITDTYTKDETSAFLNTKVDKVSGKALSSNDFTSSLKSKLESIEANADVNVQSDWNISDTSSDAYIKNKPDVYVKSEMDKALQNKADKSTTIAGYGITDTYTKDVIADLLDNKVDKVVGKSLISDTEINRLATVTNYDDTSVQNKINSINKDVVSINSNIDSITEEITQIKKVTFQLNSNDDLEAVIQL